MKGTPCLSVIVACYNNEKHIGECLGSIMVQTLADLEVVVYDDGSGDGSPAVIRDFARRYPGKIHVLHDPVNRGVAHARHQAILAARGEYITTLDGDDFYCDRAKLEKEIGLALRFRHEEKRDVLAFSNVLLVRGDAAPVPWGKPETIVQGMIGARILARDCFIPRDFTLRRELYFQAGGYDPGLEIYEDWDLKIRLAMRHEFRYTGDVGSAYRLHGGGLSARPFPGHVPVLRAVFGKYLPLAAAGEQEEIRRAFERWLSAQQERTS